MKTNLSSWIKSNQAIITILIIGAALRFFNIDFQSVWLDEIHTLNEANPNLSFSEVYDLIKVTDPHPPLYFILIKIIFSVFGYSTLVLRCYSAFIGVLGIFAIYKLGKELMNKKVALISALLLSVNYFHLYHSQDGRMYSQLFLTTVISFLFLIKFIKKPSYKTAIISGVFSSLMIYTHFFALFALFAQYTILLFFVFKPYNITTKKFLYFSFISGLTTLILYLPSINLFLATTKRDSMWIQSPEVDVFTQMFKEFYGNSEIVLFFVLVVLFFYFIKLFTRKNKTEANIDPIKEKHIFSFLILFLWILITLIIPLILSFINLPMIVNRYFINILPSLLILTAIGVSYIKNDIIRMSILGLIIVFSITDIIIVKKYYKNQTKTQFREVSQFIIDNNSNNDLVVSTLTWYFPYFLNNDVVKTTLIDKSLDIYVNEMMQDSTKKQDFWYVNGHGNKYEVSDEISQYLESNFEIQDEMEYVDAWTKHFVKKSSQPKKVNISKFFPYNKVNGKKIKYGIDNFSFTENTIKIDGWACLENQNYNNSKLNILLIKGNDEINIKYNKVIRKDVTESFKNEYNLNNSGFTVSFKLENLPIGQYELAIYIFDNKTKKEGLILTEKIISIIK